MHEAIFPEQDRLFVNNIKGHFPVKKVFPSYRKNRSIHCSADRKQECAHPSGYVDPAQVKDAENDEQLQKDPADIDDLLGNDRTLQCPDKR